MHNTLTIRFCNSCGGSLGWSVAWSAGPDGEDVQVPSPCWRCEQRAAEREAAKRRKLGAVAAGVDLRAAFAAYRRLPPFRGNLGPVRLSVGHRAEARWSGHAKTYRRQIRVAFGPGVQAHEVLEVLVHEMVHLVCPRREAHGERFRRTLARAALELWGIEVPIDPPRGDEKNTAYAMDRIIMRELATKIGAGAVATTFPPTAKPQRPARTHLKRTLVEVRAAHAFVMLKNSERRLKIAKRVIAKWRARVRYYERQAAKRAP